MKHRHQKQLYAAAIITAITSTNTWACIIDIDWLNQTTQFLPPDLNENAVTSPDNNLFKETEIKPQKLTGRYQGLFFQRGKTITLSDNGERAVDNSQGQILAANSARTNINADTILDEQNFSAENNTRGSYGFELAKDRSNTKMVLKLRTADYTRNHQSWLRNSSDTEVETITPINLVSNQQNHFSVSDKLNNSINLAMIDAIQLLILNPKDYDFQFNFLSAAPPNRKMQKTAISAPATLTLFGVGLIGIGLTRKKHNSLQEGSKGQQSFLSNSKWRTRRCQLDTNAVKYCNDTKATRFRADTTADFAGRSGNLKSACE